MNPLKPKLNEVLFKISAPTAKKTQYVYIRKNSWLILFEEIIVVYSENHK
jgi:hypothetical protein